MPELPDLHVASENITKKFKGTILSVLNTYPRKRPIKGLDAVIPAVTGSKLKGVSRMGKELLFEFNNGPAFSLHLMRVGKFQALELGAKHAVSDFVFDNGDGLTLIDFMGGCVFHLNPERPKVPDALGDDSFTLPYFLKALQKKKGGIIKALLMDQKVVRGIGNAYADEILWEARVSPKSRCGGIPEEAAARVFDSIPIVLFEAIQEIKKLDKNLIGGEIREFLKIHNSKKKTSPDGAEIIKETIGGQGTYLTNEQVIYK